MIYEIKNEQLTVEVSTAGAQMRSMVDNGTGLEYMWSGDPTIWNAVSPVLFPFIGGLNGGKYIYAGKEYSIAKHGFTRDERTVFSVGEKSEDCVTLYLTDSEETMACYPFRFKLEVEFKLNGRSVYVKYRVENHDDKALYFAVGGHPGFACPPPYASGMRTDCFIAFGKGEASLTSVTASVIGDDGLISRQRQSYLLEDGRLPITTGIFAHDAVVLEGSQVDSVSLVDKDGRPYVTLKTDMPVVAVWSKNDDAVPYVCIEPWVGRADDSGYSGTLEERPWSTKLDIGGIFETGYEIISRVP